ncbi:hypothetical protein DICA0_F26940 [Diutina catenulata]
MTIIASVTTTNLRYQSVNQLRRQSTALLATAFSRYKQFFPRDEATLGQMDAVTALHEGEEESKTIKVGVFYANHTVQANSKVIPTLLADPLAAGNRQWFDAIDKRNRTDNYQFIYKSPVKTDVSTPAGGAAATSLTQERIFSLFRRSPGQPGEADEGAQDVFMVPSPILSAIYRQRFPGTVNSTNNLEIFEINNLAAANLNDFHFLIQVTNQFKPSSFDYDIQQRVFVTVVENLEYSPPSTETTPCEFDVNSDQHIVKINSALAYGGMADYLVNGATAGEEYAVAMRDSNIFQLYKTLGYCIDTEVLDQWLMKGIASGVAANTTTTEVLDEISAKITSGEIKGFSEAGHRELQYEFEPATTRYFGRNLSWWRLYYLNDNVEYNLKDFFSLHFMPKSIESYAYLKGHIASSMQHQPYSAYTRGEDIDSNPLLAIKNELIADRLSSEVQPKVYRILAQGFVYYQLPVAVVAAVGYMHFGISANAAVAISLLGLFAGFNHVSREWLKFSRKWLSQLFEQVRTTLGHECVDEGLLKELKHAYNEEVALIEVKKGVQEMIQDKH